MSVCAVGLDDVFASGGRIDEVVSREVLPGSVSWPWISGKLKYNAEKICHGVILYVDEVSY